MTATLLFDLDGTIVETDHIHFASFKSIFAPHGVDLDWETYTARIIGSNNRMIAADFLAQVPTELHAEIMEAKEVKYREQICPPLEAVTGLVALLDWADAEGIPCGVVTNAPRANADAVLSTLKLQHRFKVVISGPELREAKPHPLPYLTALDALGGDPARSVGFEDSPSGARAAAAAGLGVIGLTTTLDCEILRASGAMMTASDFSDPAVLAFIRSRTGH